MNENTVPFKDKVVTGCKNTVAFLKANPLVSSLIAFSIVVVTLILVATLALKEFIVPVCALVILEVLMAVLLHKAELWKHGILIAAQIIAGVVIKRIPLVIVCVAIYVTAMVTLHFMFKGKKQIKVVKETLVEKEPEKKEELDNDKGPKA